MEARRRRVRRKKARVKSHGAELTYCTCISVANDDDDDNIETIRRRRARAPRLGGHLRSNRGLLFGSQTAENLMHARVRVRALGHGGA